MIRRVLNEEYFIKYINDGKVTIDGVEIIRYDKDIYPLISGKIVPQGIIQFILSDIGYPLIYDILGEIKY